MASSGIAFDFGRPRGAVYEIKEFCPKVTVSDDGPVASQTETIASRKYLSGSPVAGKDYPVRAQDANTDRQSIQWLQNRQVGELLTVDEPVNSDGVTQEG